MKKTSLKYFQVQTDIEKVIKDINPGLMNHDADRELLPAWLFVEAVEQAPIAISITDKKANILYANQTFSKVTGYRLDEVVGQNESLLSYKSTPREIYYDLWYNISRNQIWHGQLINKHKNGQPYLAELTVAPVQDSSRNTSHYLGMHRDITESYAVEKNLSNQKLLVESVINSSSIAMVVLNEDNKVVLDNQQYKALVTDLDHSEPAEMVLELLSVHLGPVHQYLIDNPQGFNSLEIRIESNKKHRLLWFSCSGKLFRNNAGDPDSFFDQSEQNYLLLSMSNITRQRLHQEEIHLQTLKAVLAEEEQIRSIRETLLGAIHQVNQPLNQIQAAIQLMEQKNEQSPLLVDLFQQLEKSCEQTVATLKHCVPEIAPSTITPINLNQILHEILMLSNNKLLSNGIVIDWKPDSLLPNIIGAENKLRMLFKQLVENAINALEKSKKPERTIAINTLFNDHRVMVLISDSGPGIPENLRSQVFQPFFTTQKMGGMQAGMGLVMAKEIVHQFNGNIEIDQDYQDGCRFIVSFPLIDQNDYNRYEL